MPREAVGAGVCSAMILVFNSDYSFQIDDEVQTLAGFQGTVKVTRRNLSMIHERSLLSRLEIH